MAILTLKEATSLMNSYGIKCDTHNVGQWLIEGKLNGHKENGDYMIEEDEVYNFIEAYRWEGTAYEKGIDDKTRVNRLLEEIADLKQQISTLQEEKEKLEDQLEILPF